MIASRENNDGLCRAMPRVGPGMVTRRRSHQEKPTGGIGPMPIYLATTPSCWRNVRLSSRCQLSVILPSRTR